MIWVRHDEFIPPKLLPTFSSPTIQFNLVHLLEWRALSDPFILMDDDVFFMKHLDLRRFAEERIWYTADVGQERKWDAPATSESQFVRLVQNSNQVR